MRKVSEATAVPFADSSADSAAAAPIPGLSVGNKPAPGQTGPKGLAPRTNYSRVNTGSPAPVDAGTSSQKGAPPDPQNFLPSKIAHREVPMAGTMTQHYTLQEMIKAAAAGARENVSVSLEAARQLANNGEAVASEKTASAGDGIESIPTSYVHKLAGACEFMVDDLRKHAEGVGPGTGPNTMGVLEATSENNEFKDGHQGQATPAHVVPMTPGTSKPSGVPGPANAMDTNEDHAVGGTQKVSGVSVEEMRKAAGLRDMAVQAAGYTKGLAKDVAAKGGDLMHKAEVAGIKGKLKARELGTSLGEGVTGSKVREIEESLKKSKAFGAGGARETELLGRLNEAKKHVARTRGAVGGGTAIAAGSAAGGAGIMHKVDKKKEASKHDPEGHRTRRALLGLPMSAAIEARKGKKMDAYLDGLRHTLPSTLKGGAIGAGTGTVAGGLAGALVAKKLHMSRRAGAGFGALAGGLGGVDIGAGAGGIKASLNKGSDEIHGRYSKHKESSALDPRLVEYFLTMTKSAEDAINPAQISAGAAVPPETSAAGEAGGAPAGGQPQGPTGLIASNESAINYTRGQAKAPMKSQLNAVVTEPALSAAHDSTLNKAWDHTGEAGTKISHSLRSSAARAVLEKMAEAACAKETKKKVSAGMGNFTAPQVTGAAQGPM